MEKNDLTISLAQIRIRDGRIEENLQDHIFAAGASACHGAQVVVFPELSLTGYALDLAGALALDWDNGVIPSLSDTAVAQNIIIIAGCPVKHPGAKPCIGAFIFFPDGTTRVYQKQHLHEGEGAYCSPGQKDFRFDCRGYTISLAICADFTHFSHPLSAKKAGADIYLVSALVSENGYGTDAGILSKIARTHNFPVLLSNHISRTGGWNTCGKSCAWDSSGEIVISARARETGLVLCTLTRGGLGGKWVPLAD